MEKLETKDLKTVSKDAKKRLKSGFWQKYQSDIVNLTEKAKEDGYNSSNVIKFYETKILQSTIPSSDENEIFYRKVCSLLEREGEVSDAIGRLIDYEKYDKLDYQAQQKYLFSISEKYRSCVERYRKEKTLSFGKTRVEQ